MRREALSASAQRFIESLGFYFEHQGVPRIGGRIMGLLMLREQPVALGEVAELLRVSPASVSTNMRQLLMRGVVKHASQPGDRRHYYLLSQSGWEGHLLAMTAAFESLGGLCREALQAPELSGLQRLHESVEFCDFYQAELIATTERWRARRARAAHPSRPLAKPSGRQRRAALR